MSGHSNIYKLWCLQPLSMNEIPKAILALQKAYDYLMSHRDGPDAGTASEEEGKAKDWHETFQS